MSLIVVLKFIHYLALFLAGGLGIGGAIIQSSHLKAETPPAPPVQRAMRRLAWLSLIAVLLLWITGFGLAYLIYGGMNIGWAFHVKLLGATGLLVANIGLNMHLTSISRTGGTPNPRLMKIIQVLARASLVLVLGGIAVTTTSI
jgi:hypothetical protein